MLYPGISELELSQLIEHAFLPNKCEIFSINANNLSLRISSHKYPAKVIVKHNIPINQVSSMRLLSGLVLEVQAALNDEAHAADNYLSAGAERYR